MRERAQTVSQLGSLGRPVIAIWGGLLHQEDAACLQLLQETQSAMLVEPRRTQSSQTNEDLFSCLSVPWYYYIINVLLVLYCFTMILFHYCSVLLFISIIVFLYYYIILVLYYYITLLFLSIYIYLWPHVFTCYTYIYTA